MTDLTKLLARVEAATGPDRKLDARLYVNLHPAPDANAVAPRYTEISSTALDLVESLGFTLHSVSPDMDGKWEASVIRGSYRERGWGVVGSATAPLAILAALLRALIASEVKS